MSRTTAGRAVALLRLAKTIRRPDLLTDPDCRGADPEEGRTIRRLQADGAREFALAAFRDSGQDVDDAIAAIDSLPDH